MKRFATLLAVVLTVVFTAGIGIGAAPDKVTLKEIQKSKPPVEFNHKAHADKVKDCKVCHHAGEAGKEQKCSACHKAKPEGKTPELKEAFHKACKDCHKKEGGNAPTKCDGCHKK